LLEERRGEKEIEKRGKRTDLRSSFPRDWEKIRGEGFFFFPYTCRGRGWKGMRRATRHPYLPKIGWKGPPPPLPSRGEKKKRRRGGKTERGENPSRKREKKPLRENGRRREEKRKEKYSGEMSQIGLLNLTSNNRRMGGEGGVKEVFFQCAPIRKKGYLEGKGKKKSRISYSPVPSRYHLGKEQEGGKE